jgi:zinc transport system substrate-binding protein
MMNKKLFKYIFIIPIIIVILGCKSGSHKKNCISVSIPPVKYFVDKLTDKKIKVNVMVPSGVAHDTYEPTPKQLQKLSDSRLYIRIGYLGYERSWIHRLEELNPEMNVVNLSDAIELICGEPIKHGDHYHEGGIDPHIWMSPKTMKRLLPVIRNALISSFPNIQETVDKNYNNIFREVNNMHFEYTLKTQFTKNKKFMIFHPALTYLAKDYNLEQISIEFEGKEPSPARLAEIIKLSKRERIKYIFIQAEYDENNAKQIASETGATLVKINPMAYDWMKMMDELKEYL